MSAVCRDRRFLLFLAPATITSALAVGIPTDVVPNPWFQRMTPVRTFDSVLLPLLSLALGALIATYAVRAAPDGVGQAAGGGLLATFAIGCPVCNKLVVAVLGFSGAVTYFEPIQPLLGLASLALTLYALRRRAQAFATGCPLPARA